MIIFPVIILVLGLGVHGAHRVVLEVDLVQVCRNGQRRPIKLSFFVWESKVLETLVEQLLETSLILHNILTHLFRVPSNSHILEALRNPEFYCSVKTPWIAVVNPKQKYPSYGIIDASLCTWQRCSGEYLSFAVLILLYLSLFLRDVGARLCQGRDPRAR